MKEIYIPKREVTQTKIQLASDAIRDENDKRRKINKKKIAEGLEPKLPLIKHTFEHTARRQLFKKYPGPIKSMHTVVLSNKVLCGSLSRLCNTLRKYQIVYPWLETGA